MEGTQEVSNKALTIIEQGKSVVVKNSEDYLSAGNLYTTIKGIMKQVDDSFDPIISKAHQAHKEAVQQKAKIYDPLKAAYVFVKKVMSDYDTEQERKRQEEQRRLEEIARKQAEEQALFDAIAAEEEAQRSGATKEEAAQVSATIIDEPVWVAPVVIQKEVPKVQGLSFRKIWKFKIENASIIPREYLTPDEVKIGGVVRADKGATNIPGIKAYEVKV